MAIVLRYFMIQILRSHEALEGKTPAKKCGNKIEGHNKWKTIIQNAKLV
jgi:hypothetical protein